MSNRFHDIGLTCAVNGNAAVEEGYATHDLLFQGDVINNTGQKGGCPNGGTSAHGLYLAGYHSSVFNNLISNAAGAGIELYHDPCQSAVSNNTVFHNYTIGIQVAGNPDGKWSGCADDDYNSINNNLVPTDTGATSSPTFRMEPTEYNSTMPTEHTIQPTTTIWPATLAIAARIPTIQS